MTENRGSPADRTLVRLTERGWTLTELHGYDSPTRVFSGEHVDFPILWLAVREDGSHKFFRHLRSTEGALDDGAT